MKKDKLITIRISEEDRKLIDEIKSIDKNFNLSTFFRDIINRKWVKITNPEGVGFMKVGAAPEIKREEMVSKQAEEAASNINN